MSPVDPKTSSPLGFLTVLEHELGLIGGYLVLNATGRPLEFHCTAPVKPNRAQQILFGPTLEPYLYGEQIGQALLGKGATEPGVVCTDLSPVLAVREFTALPVALVLAKRPSIDNGPTEGSSQSTWRLDPPHASPDGLNIFELGANRLAVPIHRDADRRQILERLASAAAFDLAEPFERIREAIQEANKTAQS